MSAQSKGEEQSFRARRPGGKRRADEGQRWVAPEEKISNVACGGSNARAIRLTVRIRV